MNIRRSKEDPFHGLYGLPKSNQRPTDQRIMPHLPPLLIPGTQKCRQFELGHLSRSSDTVGSIRREFSRGLKFQFVEVKCHEKIIVPIITSGIQWRFHPSTNGMNGMRFGFRMPILNESKKNQWVHGGVQGLLLLLLLLLAGSYTVLACFGTKTLVTTAIKSFKIE